LAKSCKACEPEITAAQTGNYRPEHLFVLRQNFEAFEFHQRQIPQCDQAIVAQLTSLAQTRLEQILSRLIAMRNTVESRGGLY
jgi:hypothetical protein